MNKLRKRKNRVESKLARAFMAFNLGNKPEADIAKDFNLGIKVQEGRLESVNEIIRAIAIIKDLASLEIITKEQSTEILTNLAQKMTGFKVVKG